MLSHNGHWRRFCMGILVDIFDKERRHLSERIGDGPPEKAARIIRDFLSKLPAEYEEKNTDLTLNEKRRLGFLIDLLQAASSLLVVPSAELYRPYQPDDRPVGGDTRQGTLKKAAQIVLFVLLLGGLLAVGAFSALLLLVAVRLPFSILGNYILYLTLAGLAGPPLAVHPCRLLSGM